MDSLYVPAKRLSQEIANSAEALQASLTKPPGSLGYLEKIAIRLAAQQHCLKPKLDKIMIRVFAADHGIARENVSAFPQAVTVEMIRNFVEGGAAISVLAREIEANFAVINMGTVSPTTALSGDYPGLLQEVNVGEGTASFCREKAMNFAQLESALLAGLDIVNNASEQNISLFIGGEMGIGNTTSASALACALLNKPVQQMIGRGTGVDDEGLSRKLNVVSDALQLHDLENAEPLYILRCVGGFEIAGLVGAYIGCAQKGIPVLVDGFISSVAALVAVRINPSIKPWLFYSHKSEEKGHALVLAALEARPLVALDMRLGEASGAALVVPLMRAACLLHGQMATFKDAGVSEA